MQKAIIATLLLFFIQQSLHSIEDPSLPYKTIPEIIRYYQENKTPQKHPYYVIGIKLLNGFGLSEPNRRASASNFIKAIELQDTKAVVPIGFTFLCDEQAHNYYKDLFNDIDWLKKMAQNDAIAPRWLMQLIIWSPGLFHSDEKKAQCLKQEIVDFLKNKKPFSVLLEKSYVQDASIIKEISKNILDSVDTASEMRFFIHAVLGSHENLEQAEKIALTNFPCLMQLQDHYSNGSGMAKNSEKAHALERAIIESDSTHELAELARTRARLNYGKSLLTPKISEQTMETVISLFKDATVDTTDVMLLNSPARKEAFYLLGVFKRLGIADNGSPKSPDYVNAIKYFKAAGPDYDQALYSLAQLYEMGFGNEQELQEARKFYDKILSSKDPKYNHFKAMMYELGQGVEKNLAEAQKYYESNLKVDDLFLRRNAEEGCKRIDRQLAKRSKRIAKKNSSKIAQAYAVEDDNNSDCSDGEAEISAIEMLKFRKAGTVKKIEKKHSQVIQVPGNLDNSKIVEALNDAISYNDKSYIESLDAMTGTMTIINPFDSSKITLFLDKERATSIKPQDIQNIKPYHYDPRVIQWFDSSETDESTERHRFAQRLDEIVQLCGKKAFFVKVNGKIEKNKILTGFIEKSDQKRLDGIFEYSYYNDIVYHRFFHPNSKTVLA